MMPCSNFIIVGSAHRSKRQMRRRSCRAGRDHSSSCQCGFMLMAHLGKSPAVIAGVSGIVVIADFIFTATAVVAQPVTGVSRGYPKHSNVLHTAFMACCWLRRLLVSPRGAYRT